MGIIRRKLFERTKRLLGRATSLAPEHYQYASLSPGGYIRTLVLLPGSGQETLRCSLQTSLISDTRFEAISYVWGSDIKDHAIVCQGQTLAITSNLWTVLQNVRSDVPRVLWADSICINQEDLEEKSHQVRMMGQIYRSANRVLIFIGSDDFGHGANVSSLLDDMSAMIRPIIEQPDVAPHSFPWPDDNAPILKDTRWESLGSLFEQSWFTRGWVAQEAALAKDGHMIWGKYQFDWFDLGLTVTWMLHRAYTSFEEIWVKFPSIHQRLYWSYHKHTTQAFTLKDEQFEYLDVIYEAKRLQFSDPRDRIFAFGEIAQDLDRRLILQPDYNVPVLQVYQKFAMDQIHHSKIPIILDYVSHTEESLQETVPSWFPRLDITTDAIALLRYGEPLRSRSLSIPEPVLMDGSVLKVRGVVVDSVVYASKATCMSVSETIPIIQNLWRDLCASESNSAYPTAHLVDVLLAALTVAKFQGQWAKWRSDVAAFALHLLENTSGVDEAEMARRRLDAQGGDEIQAIACVRLYLYEKKLILTQRGYMGLAPQVTQEGDTVAIIFGCTMPFILRETGKELQYRLVGSTLIMGKKSWDDEGRATYSQVLGEEESKDWVDWDVEEQDIHLC
jgi:hypothetical protein